MDNCRQRSLEQTSTPLPDEVTVCLADDDPLISSLFSRVIARAGHKTILASDPDSALAILETRDVQLLLSDWRMPVPEEGERLLRAVRSLYPALKVCIMSGEMHPDEQALALSLGASMYIKKPFSAETFSDIIVSLREASELPDKGMNGLLPGAGAL